MSATYTFSYPNAFTGDVLAGELEIRDDLAFDYKMYTSINYINKLLAQTTLYPRFRIFLLNPDETTRTLIPNDDIILGGSYSENYQNGQRRSLSFTLINEDGKYNPNINSIWINNKFLLEIGLQIPDTEGVLWFKKGVFTLSSASPSRTKDQKTVSIECNDKFVILDGKSGVIDTTLEIPSGTDIKSIIKDILSSNTGTGYMRDYQDLIYHSSFEGKKTPLTISMNAGQTYGDLLSQLAEILSAEIFYNSNGNLTVVPTSEVIQDGDKPVIYNYSLQDCNFKNEDFSIGMTEFINQIVVIGANVNGHTCMAVAKNDDPASPLCYQRIGLRTSIINDSNITNDILAQERADYELRKVLIAKSNLSSSVFLNPLLSVNNIITYSDDFYQLTRERFLIQSINIQLNYDGIMSITASNINNLPFVI